MDYTTIVLSLLGTIALSSLLWIVSVRKVGDWEERGINGMIISWESIFLLSISIAVILSVLTAILGGSLALNLGVGLMGWVGTLTFFTDLKTYKIPKEPSILAYQLGFVLLAYHAYTIGSWQPFLSAGMWLLIPTLLFFMAGDGIGMADIRLLILTGVTVAYFVPVMYMLYTLIAASLVQGLFFLVAKLTGRGKMAPKGFISSDPMDNWDGSLDGEKLKLHLPFGPALIGSFAVLGVYSATIQPLKDCALLIMC